MTKLPDIIIGTTSSTDNGLSIVTANNSVGRFYFADATSGSAAYAAYMIYDHTADAMQIGTGSATRLKIDSGGDIDVETGDIFFSTAGKGIVLGATSNTDANTLDDYEEGTWTASIDTAGGSVTLASGTDLCSYTKIGNMVTVRGKIAVDSISSPSGAANMTGLPFTSTNSFSENSARSGGAMLHDSFSGLSTGAVVYQTFENTTTVNLFEQFANGVGAIGDNFTANSILIFELSYPAA